MVSVYYKSLLNSEEKKVYDELVSGYMSLKDEITVDCSDVKTVWKIVDYVSMDRPDFFFVNFSHTAYRVGSQILLECEYFFSENQIKLYYNQVHEIGDKIVKQCTGKNDFGTALKLHDYLAKNIEYELYDDTPDSQRSIVGALIRKQCCCAGYARAYKFLCEKAGIHCIYVRGDDKDGGPHAWNMVKINGNNYFVDVTYDDYRGEVFCSREFFMLSTEELLRTHIPNPEYKLPKCEHSMSLLPVINTPQDLLDRLRHEKKFDPIFTEYRFIQPVDFDEFINLLHSQCGVNDYGIMNCIAGYSVKDKGKISVLGVRWK
ncbi:MAG: hypothetical protein IKB88_11860 [Clostridia bacterium]|nr:hypothetical protein [Clostridia bacterium]